jgi:hypothetical protein
MCSKRSIGKKMQLILRFILTCEEHFLIDCPAYQDMRQKFLGLELDACTGVAEFLNHCVAHMGVANYRTYVVRLGTGRKNI